MLSMAWMVLAFAVGDSLGTPDRVGAPNEVSGDTGRVLKALPARKPSSSGSPYALPVESTKPPIQLGVSGWGERGFLQLRLPAQYDSPGFHLTFGGARTTESKSNEVVKSRREFTELQGRLGFLVQPVQAPAFASCNLDLGFQVRKFWEREVIDSAKTARSSAFGVQPCVGLEALFWISPGVLALQTHFRTGPEWQTGESLSGFRLHGWASVGLVFTP